MTADDLVRASVVDLPIPPMPKPAFNKPPPLAKARVAIVTTAGLMRPGEENWAHDDAIFRSFDRDERGLIVGHISMGFDRAGVSSDVNVIYPVDVLKELAVYGTIGSVAQRHLSFMGALRDPRLITTLMEDSVPEAAKMLKDDNVDIAIITPACPVCSRTINFLGHALEANGISTVVLASNLESTKRIQPPRSLFCDFPLGRPLGKPNDIEYQKKVLNAAFSLLEQEQGPVLEVFPDIIKDKADTPVERPLPSFHDTSEPEEVDEALGLKPAWEKQFEKAGATQLGRRIGVDQVPAAIKKMRMIANGSMRSEVFSNVGEFLQTAMDIRVYYEEAALGLTYSVPAARSTEAWFYQKTKTGALFHRLVDHLNTSGRAEELGMAGLFYLVPPSQSRLIKGGTAPWQQSPSVENRH